MRACARAGWARTGEQAGRAPGWGGVQRTRGQGGSARAALEGAAGRLRQIFEVGAVRAPGPDPLQPLPKRTEPDSRRSPTCLKSPISYQLQPLPFLGAKRAFTPTVNLPLSREAFNGIGQAVLNSPHMVLASMSPWGPR